MIALSIRQIYTVMVFIIFSLFMSNVFSALAMGTSSVACAGARLHLLGLDGWLAIPGICGKDTAAGIAAGESPGSIDASSDSRKATALAVTHLQMPSVQNSMYLNVKWFLESS